MSERSSASPEDLDRFRAALRRAPVVLFAQDRDLRYTWVHNPAYSTPGQILGKTDADLLPPSDAAVLTQFKAGVLRTGAGARREVCLHTPAGVKHYDLSVEPTRDADGRVTGVAGTALDVTERVEAEAARREGEAWLRLAQDAAGIGIHDFDPVTGRIRWCERVRELWGVGPDEPVTYDLFLSGLHPDDRGPTQAAVDRALDPAGDGRYSAEYRVTSRRDGVERWVAATGAVTFAGGRAVRLVGTVHDVTDRKRAGAALLENHRFISEVTAVVPGVVYVFDLIERRNVYTNRHTAAVLGYPDDEVIGLGPDFLPRVLHPDDAARFERHIDRLHALPAGEAAEVEYRLRHRDGSWRWFLSRDVVYRRDPDGRARQVLGIATDITARKRAEEQLRRNADTFSGLVRNSPFGVYTVDSGFRLSEVSAGARKVFAGIDPLIGRDFAEVLRIVWEEPFAGEAIGRFRHTLATGEPYRAPETTERRRNIDAVESHDWKVERITLPDGEFGVVCHFYDLSERRRYEAALRASEERFRLAADAVDGIIYDFDPRTGRVERTRGLAEVLGYRPDEVPPTAEWWWGQIHPDDRGVIGRQASPPAGDRFTTEYRVRHKDGRWLDVEDRAVVRRDPAGAPARMVGCTVDVTARKRAEAELREHDRRKDEFLATLAHELRNPLAPVRNAVQFLMADGPPDPDLVWARGLIDRQVRVMARLLDDLLDVSRITRGKLDLRRERVELAAVVAAAVETSRPLIDAGGHELTVSLPADPVALDADPVRLAQVFANLLNNAAKYTDRGGHVRLTAERAGDRVAVAVADDGIGLAADMLPRLFEIFSQAEPARERSQGGLGIGLSLVRGLVELHGGTIEARSDGPGRGSTFLVRLPTAVPAAPAPPAPPPESGGGPRCRLLIADDLQDGADSLALLLEMMGHEVRTAYDGEQAVAAAAEFRPDVVLLDLGMPKVAGDEACRRIRRQPWGRQMCLVAMTGWGQEDDRRRTAEAGFDHHLVKPVDMADLKRLLAARVGTRGPSSGAP